MSRQLDNWSTYFDNERQPLLGRLTFFKLHTTEKITITTESGIALDNPIHTTENGKTTHQVFLPDEDVTVLVEKYIGGGNMSDDENNLSAWVEQYTFDSLKNTVVINVGDENVLAGYASTYEELRHMDFSACNYAVLAGYYNMGDMPPVQYRLVRDATLHENGGSVIYANGSTEYRWVLIPGRVIDCRVFGVFPSEDDQTIRAFNSQLRWCFSYANSLGLDVYMPQVYEGHGYYYIEGANHTLGQKLYIDNGVQIVAKPGMSSTLTVDAIEFYGKNLFRSGGEYGNLTVNCPEVCSSWACRTWDRWPGTIREMIVDSFELDNRVFTISGAIVEVRKNVGNMTISFVGCEITGNRQFTTSTIAFNNCGYISDRQFADSCTLGTFANNQIRIDNFRSANTYIKWKNQQGDYDYGDLGEQTLNNAQIYSPCVLENASGTITYMGGPSGTTVEMHNVSGTITGNFENTILNLIDCWATLVNTNANNDVRSIQHRRGSLISNTLVNLHDDSYFEGVDIRAALVTPEGKSTFKDCHIRNTLATFEVDCFDCFIYNTVTTYPNPTTNIYTFRFEGCTFEVGGHHSVTGQNAGGILQNCSWIDNINKSGVQFVSLNRTVLDADDTHHTYVYEGNRGANTLQYKAAKWTGKLHDPTNASCGRQTGGWSPNSGGPSLITWSWTGASMIATGQAATDVNLYIAEFQMFSVGTTNLGELSLRTTPPSVVGVPDPYQPTHVRKSYIGGIAMTTSLSDVERTRAEWQYDQTGTPFCKGYAHVGGYTWRVTNAGTMFAVWFNGSDAAITRMFEGDFNFEIFQ